MLRKAALGDVSGAKILGWVTNWRIILIASVLLLVSTYIPRLHAAWFGGAGIFDSAGEPFGADYVNIWTTARMVLDGRVAELFDAAGFHAAQEAMLGRPFQDHNWSYPPHFVPWILVFGLAPYLWGFALWMGTTFGAYLAAVLPGRPQKTSLFLALLLAPSTYANLAGGQNGFLTAALLLGALRLLERHPIWAGVLFGLLTVKPQLGILVPVALIAAGAWRAIFSALITTALSIAASIALFGVEPWIAYLRETTRIQAAVLEYGTGLFTLMMPTPFMAARIMDWGIGVGYGLNAVIALGAAIVVGWVYRARWGSTDLRAAVLLTATLLASPYAFNYDMTALSAVLLCIMACLPNKAFRQGELLAFIATWSLPMTVLLMNNAGIPLAPVVLAGMLAFLTLRAKAGTA
jgi:alpha-1,2-mannosyltransferase